MCEKYIEEIWSCPLNTDVSIWNFFFYSSSSDENKTHLHLDGHFRFWPTWIVVDSVWGTVGILMPNIPTGHLSMISGTTDNWKFSLTGRNRAAAESGSGDNTGAQVWEPLQKLERTVPGSRGRMHLAVTSWFFLLFPYGHLSSWITAMYMNILQSPWPSRDVRKHHLPSFNSEFQSFV